MRVAMLPISGSLFLMVRMFDGLGMSKVAAIPSSLFIPLARLYGTLGKGGGEWIVLVLDRNGETTREVGRWGTQSEARSAFEYFHSRVSQPPAFMVLCGECGLFFVPPDHGWACHEHRVRE